MASTLERRGWTLHVNSVSDPYLKCTLAHKVNLHSKAHSSLEAAATVAVCSTVVCSVVADYSMALLLAFGRLSLVSLFYRFRERFFSTFKASPTVQISQLDWFCT